MVTPTKFLIEFDGPGAGMPLDLIASVMRHIQRVVYLIALQVEGVEAKTRTRVRISRDIKRDYELFSLPGVSDERSFRVFIGEPERREEAPEVISTFMRTCSLISARQSWEVLDHLPDKIIRNSILDSLSTAIPSAYDDWTVRILYLVEGVPLEATFSEKTALFLDQFLVSRTVTGEFLDLSGDERCLSILFPPTGQVVECRLYEPVDQEIVRKILTLPRNHLIHVKGKLLARDNLVKVIDVEDISRIDLSPVTLDSFRYPKRIISFRKSVCIVPELDESKQLLVLEYPFLNLHVFSESREGLLRDLHGMIEALWELYAKAADETLSEDAQDLKCRLMDSLREDSLDQVQEESQEHVEG
jgi:hypothetical protein